MSDAKIIHARHFATGEWIRVSIDGPRIGSVETTGRGGPVTDVDPWIAPAFWDLQVNGRWGVSFSDSTVTSEQVVRITEAQTRMGTGRFCPTLITASHESTLAGVRAIAEACDADPVTNHQVLGIHLEGPWISPTDGYRGAHPRDHVRDPDLHEFLQLQLASGNRINLVTLAPERPGAINFIRHLNEMGVKVAVGHSAATSDIIDQAIAAGLTLVTHLGNGVPALLPRHPNVIWSLAARESLWTSFIADGHHVDRETLGVLMNAKAHRSFIVSDASPLSGSEPGLYGPWEVREDGRIVVAGTPYLAGSNGTMLESIENLMRWLSLSPSHALAAATIKPALALSLPSPKIESGQPSDLVLLRFNSVDEGKEIEPVLQLLGTCILGSWTMPEVCAEETAPGD